MSYAKTLVQKQVWGSIVAYVNGRKSGAHINWVAGITSAAIKREYLTKNEVFKIMDEIEKNPTILPSLSQRVKK